jgi:hypothetical protein
MEHQGHPLPPALFLDVVEVPQLLGEARVEVKLDLRDLHCGPSQPPVERDDGLSVSLLLARLTRITPG